VVGAQVGRESIRGSWLRTALNFEMGVPIEGRPIVFHKSDSGYLKMDTAIINLPAVIDQPQLPSTLRAALETAADLASNSRAASTRAANASDWRIFTRWSETQGLCPMPASPATVAAFLADQVKAGMKPSTLGRRLAAIKYRHKTAGEDSPTDDVAVKAVLQGARRSIGVAPRKLAAATSEKTIGMATLVRPGLAGLRDRAILLLAFSLAARRSELVALDVEDLEECPEGLRVRIRKSKTDQEGVGATVAVCRGSIACPVTALKDYLEAAGVISGPVFRRIRRGNHITDQRLTAQTICRIVKDHAAKLGLDPKQYGAHSLRAGFLTSAAVKGANLFKMMDVSRHKSVDTLKGYVRSADAFRDHASAGLL
jgi:site-specific recombinase XerD